MDLGKLSTLLYPLGVPSEFVYPWDRMYVLKTILAAAKIKEPNSQDSTGDPAHFVFKRGSTTLTTIGRLNGFESRQRRYSLFGNFDSVEAAVCPYGNGRGPFSQAGPFSQGGDSGAAIVGPNNDFIAQLTGGTGLSDYSDIIYGTPMEWLWNDVIKVKFPNAELFFDVPTDK